MQVVELKYETRRAGLTLPLSRGLSFARQKKRHICFAWTQELYSGKKDRRVFGGLYRSTSFGDMDMELL